MRAWLTDAPLDPADLLAMAGGSADGARLLFVGTVRDRNEGRDVNSLTYQAYVEMAEPVLARIVEEAVARFGVSDAVAVHRVGDVAVGDASVAILVVSPHRAQAYDANRYIIEEIKRRLPIWKEEQYTQGGAQWLSGRSVAGPEGARE